MNALTRQQRFLGGINLPQRTTFPDSPLPGDICFVNGSLFIHAELDGLTSWFPLSHKFAQHVHNQGTALKKWIVRHPFNTDDVAVTVWNGDKEIEDALIKSTQDSEGRWQVEIDLAIAQKGKAIVFGVSEIGLNLAHINSLEVEESLTYGGERVLRLSDREDLLGVINAIPPTVTSTVDAQTAQAASINSINSTLGTTTDTLDTLSAQVISLLNDEAAIQTVTTQIQTQDTAINDLQAIIDQQNLQMKDLESRNASLEVAVQDLETTLAEKAALDAEGKIPPNYLPESINEGYVVTDDQGIGGA